MKRTWSTFTACAGLTVVTLASVRASALVEKTRASFASCVPISDAQYTHTRSRDDIPGDLYSTGDYGGEGTSSSYPGKFYCAVEDSSAVPAASLTWVHVHGYDLTSADHFWAIACTKFYDNEGGSCAAGQNNGPNSFTGPFGIALDTNWPSQASFGFPYLYVEVPGYSSGIHWGLLYGYSAGTP